jgi:hypothetical protein
MFRINPKFDLLRVDEWERFGNSVMQLRNVIYVAEHLGVGAIAFPEKHPFFSGEHAVTAKCNSHTLAFAFCKGSDGAANTRRPLWVRSGQRGPARA